MEVFTGLARTVDEPGLNTMVQPGAFAISADGFMYLPSGSRLLRVNLATQTVTSLPATSAPLNFPLGYPSAAAIDPQGDLYVATLGALFRVDPVSGTTTNVGAIDTVEQMQFAADGTLYYISSEDWRIRARLPSGQNVDIAGTGEQGFSGDAGPAISAQLKYPRSLALASNGDIFVADTNNNRIRRISAATGVITTIAGTGTSAFNGDGMVALQTNFAQPNSIVFDAAGNLVVSDWAGFRIRRIDATSGLVSTIAGTGQYGYSGDGSLAVNAKVYWARYLAFDAAGNLYFADNNPAGQNAHNLRKIAASTGIISRIMGNDTNYLCGENAPIRGACLANPRGLDVDGAGNLLIGDSVNFRVRKAELATGLMPTVANISFSTVFGVEHDAAGNVYFTSWDNNRVYKIDAASGQTTIFAGAGASPAWIEAGTTSPGFLNLPSDIAIDSAGNLYIADSGSNRIRKLDVATRTISTYAGRFNGFSGDGGLATSAYLSNPSTLEFDPAGNLVISDGLNCRLRRVDKNTGIINTIAGNGTCSVLPAGENGPATATSLNTYQPFAFGPDGNLYLGYQGQLRRVNYTTGIVTTLPAPVGGYKTPEGKGFSDPKYLEFDAAGRLYIGDTYQNLIYRMTGLFDSSPPVVEPVIVGAAGQSGWYRSNVTVSWSVSDPESGVSSKSGCTTGSVTADTNGVTFFCFATSVGGNTSKSVTIKRDTVAPTLIFGTASPASDASGWNTGDVTIPFTTADDRSGVFATTEGSPLVFTGSGENLGRPLTVTDLAGNSATYNSPAVNIDRVAPQVEYVISGTQGLAGWYISDAQVTWTVTANGSPANITGCATAEVTTDTAGLTFTCSATSAAGTTSKSVTIRRDATPPTLEFGAPNSVADANGWRASPVNVPYTAGDAMSGVAITSAPSPLSLTTPGAAVTGQVVVTDVAGNSATFTTEPYQIDSSAPTVTSFVYGTTGTNGWYKSDARVTFSVSDDESDVSSEGCAESVVSTDTAGTTFTCTATSAGGSTTKSITVKRDATAPTLSWGAPSPAPNAAGWNTTDVSFAYTTGDAMSGVAGTSHPSPAIVSADGPGVSTQITVFDNAGNSTTLSTPAVNIDRAAPIVNYFVSGTPGNNGWYTDDVQVTWQVVKAPENILAQTGCVNTTVTADTTGTTIGCSVTSGAGTTSQSVTIKRDATPPTLQWGAFSPNPNANGWNKTNVTVPFTRADATSGIASTSAASPLTLATEGAGITGQVTVADNAGNSQTFVTDPRNIDKTAPVVAIVAPANGATYGFYQDVVANYSCTDVSLLSCAGPNANGDFVNTKTSGPRTFKVTAKDQVALTTSVTNSFNIDNNFNFEGFLPGVVPLPSPNLVAKGSLVPIRWRLPDGHGGYVTNTASFTSATVQSYSCSGTPVPLNDPATGPAGISFDPSTNVFTYNWQTGSSWTGCRKLVIKLKDGNLHELVFKFQ